MRSFKDLLRPIRLYRPAAALLACIIVLYPMTTAADPGSVRAAFREDEQDAWRDYIRRFPDGTIPGDFDVAFYYLDVDIAAVNPPVSYTHLTLPTN